MQLRITHTTTFTFDGRAQAAHQQARLTPLTTPEQIVVHNRLEISPKPWTYEYRDYFGSLVTAFEISEPHETLSIVATSTVQTNRSPAGPPTLTWADLEGWDVADRWTEYLVLPEQVAPDDALAAAVRSIADAAALPGEAARAICGHVHAELEAEAPDPIPVSRVVHRAIGALRSVGIPARYVSGYFHPDAEPAVGVPAAAHAHAWLQWWDAGWHAFDPTNDSEPGDRYVSVATGRDYLDVKPVSGIFAGAALESLAVGVEIVRLA